MRHHAADQLQVQPALEPRDDDRPIGRVLSRREVLALMGGTGLTVVAATYAPTALGADPSAGPGAGTSPSQAGGSPSASSLPSCIVRPEQTEGPYFVDERIERSDVRSDHATGEVQAGLPLGLTFLVSRIDGSECAALEGAVVDIWHCNAAGAYSDVSSDPTFGDTSGTTFLRGYQRTDPAGRASFTTIYPGWYQGRTVHIHFKIRTDPDASSGYDFTSQLFFDDTLTDTVFAQEPYASKGIRTLRNDGDGIYGQGGDQLMLSLTALDSGGYTAAFPIGIQIA